MDVVDTRRIVVTLCLFGFFAGCATPRPPPPACNEAALKLTPAERAVKFRETLKALRAPGLLELRGVDAAGSLVMTIQGLCTGPTEMGAIVDRAELALNRRDYTQCEPPVIVIHNACYFDKP